MDLLGLTCEAHRLRLPRAADVSDYGAAEAWAACWHLCCCKQPLPRKLRSARAEQNCHRQQCRCTHAALWRARSDMLARRRQLLGCVLCRCARRAAAASPRQRALPHWRSTRRSHVLAAPASGAARATAATRAQVVCAGTALQCSQLQDRLPLRFWARP